MPKQVKAIPVVGRAISPMQLMAELKKRQEQIQNSPHEPLSPEKQAEIDDAVKQLKAMGGFAVFHVPVKEDPK